MTNTTHKVTLLRPTTLESDVHERLASLYDGEHRVVAYEVRDSPSARIDPDGRYGADPGCKIGEWVLGRVEDVLAFLEDRGYQDYELMDEVGFDIEGPASGESRSEVVAEGYGPVSVYRYPGPDLEDGELASFRVETVGYMDDGNFLGTIRALADGEWAAKDREWELLVTGVSREQALRAVSGIDTVQEFLAAPTRKQGFQVVELSVKLRVDVGAWELAYGDMGGEAGLADDVKSYVETLLGESSQRSANFGGEGGLADYDVDHA